MRTVRLVRCLLQAVEVLLDLFVSPSRVANTPLVRLPPVGWSAGVESARPGNAGAHDAARDRPE